MHNMLCTRESILVYMQTLQALVICTFLYCGYSRTAVIIIWKPHPQCVLSLLEGVACKSKIPACMLELRHSFLKFIILENYFSHLSSALPSC